MRAVGSDDDRGCHLMSVGGGWDSVWLLLDVERASIYRWLESRHVLVCLHSLYHYRVMRWRALMMMNMPRLLVVCGCGMTMRQVAILYSELQEMAFRSTGAPAMLRANRLRRTRWHSPTVPPLSAEDDVVLNADAHIWPASVPAQRLFEGWLIRVALCEFVPRFRCVGLQSVLILENWALHALVDRLWISYRSASRLRALASEERLRNATAARRFRRRVVALVGADVAEESSEEGDDPVQSGSG